MLPTIYQELAIYTKKIEQTALQLSQLNQVKHVSVKAINVRDTGTMITLTMHLEDGDIWDIESINFEELTGAYILPKRHKAYLNEERYALDRTRQLFEDYLNTEDSHTLLHGLLVKRKLKKIELYNDKLIRTALSKT